MLDKPPFQIKNWKASFCLVEIIVQKTAVVTWRSSRKCHDWKSLVMR